MNYVVFLSKVLIITWFFKKQYSKNIYTHEPSKKRLNMVFLQKDLKEIILFVD
jgi:hypothetical protein